MSTIRDNWINGKGFPDVLVIDGHIHVGEWPHAATFQSMDEAEERSLEFMDRNGVDAICALSGGCMFFHADYRLGNDLILEYWQRLGDRVIPFCHVNPLDTEDNIVSELDRMVAAGIRCIKLLNSYQDNYPDDGPNMVRVCEYAAEHKMLLTNHSWGRLEVLRDFSTRFPDVDFIHAHYGGGDPLLSERPNVFTSVWAYGGMGWLDGGLALAGAHKFITGSDGFLNPMSVGIGPVVFAPLSDNDLRLVLGLNIARLLHKVGALPPSLVAKAGLSEG